MEHWLHKLFSATITYKYNMVLRKTYRQFAWNFFVLNILTFVLIKIISSDTKQYANRNTLKHEYHIITYLFGLYVCVHTLTKLRNKSSNVGGSNAMPKLAMVPVQVS